MFAARREQYEPLFSHLFGLHPWDVDRLTYARFERYVAFADRYNKEASEHG